MADKGTREGGGKGLEAGDARDARAPGHVVVMGASAGGLDALQHLLMALPPDLDAPIVVAIHLDPHHESRIDDLLQRQLRLTVKKAVSGEVLRPGTVYVAVPDHHLEVRAGKILLTRGPRVRFSRPSIDQLFLSAARSYGDGAIAIVLSGTGSDGAAGVGHIKAHGGFVLAQEPGSAAFPSMPQAACDTGHVDAVVRVEEMAGLLIRAVRDDDHGFSRDDWKQFFDLVRDATDRDLSKYRATTVERRVRRRMVVRGIAGFADYLELLKQDPEELDMLQTEINIKVSACFRDEAAWEEVATEVVRPLVEDLEEGAELRVWSAGCATGEEAYSLAILFAEALGADQRHRVRIFATDVDVKALEGARAGLYTADQLAGLSENQLEDYFVEEGHGWRAGKPLRQMIVFAKQDLLTDPSLGSMDLVVCRNVIIYFAPEHARAAIGRFAYALRPGGFLFLGKAETVHNMDNLFAVVSGTSKIYRRTEVPITIAPVTPQPSKSRAPKDGSPEAAPGPLSALEHATNTIVVATDSARRVSFWNKGAEIYFQRTGDEARHQAIEHAVGPVIWSQVEPLTRKAVATGQATSIRAIRPSDPRGAALDVECIATKAEKGDVFIFIAHPATARPVSQDPADPDADAAVLASSSPARMEELYEALQSTAEMQQALNEELQSRNEELETVNEELQSLNEELNTLNEEVGVRINEAERLSAFLRAVLDSSPQPIIGCDSEDQITFWNDAAADEFWLSKEQAVDRPLFKLVPALGHADVRALLKGEPGERDELGAAVIETAHGRFKVQASVTRDSAGRSHGYVLRVVRQSGDAETPSGGA